MLLIRSSIIHLGSFSVFMLLLSMINIFQKNSHFSHQVSFISCVHRPKFGWVLTLSKDGFLDAIDKEKAGVTVMVLLYEEVSNKVSEDRNVKS